MIKVFIPNTSKPNAIGGGWTFIRNFKKCMRPYVEFVDDLESCDLLFVQGVTTCDPGMVHQARALGKQIILRVDNVPKKSRNRRSTPHERLQEYAKLADVVVYQSEWAKNYCYPLSGEGVVIYNGVDRSIFYPRESKEDQGILDLPTNKYLFAYHGKSELKQFWLAHLHFQYIARENPNAEFIFAYDFGSELTELANSNYDFWNGEKHQHIPLITTPELMAETMRECDALIYPSVSDASPNIVLEARACGLQILYPAPTELAGTQELMNPDLDISLDRMAKEYAGLIQLLFSEKEIEI